jgi:hypothetical protein
VHVGRAADDDEVRGRQEGATSFGDRDDGNLPEQREAARDRLRHPACVAEHRFIDNECLHHSHRAPILPVRTGPNVGS